MFEPITRQDFVSRIKTKPEQFDRLWHDAQGVISLRQMAEVYVIQTMPTDYLKSLLYSMPLTGCSTRKPYWGCEFRLQRVDPVSLQVGQTFVERKKCDSLLYAFGDRFKGHCVTHGIAKLTASVVLGCGVDGRPMIAHYVPPIIEESDNRHLLVDGVHRNFLAMNVGTTIEAVVVEHPTEDYPCKPQVWDQVTPVEEKPPEHKRFFNLRKELFRDLKYVGIDG
ncbi:MAG: hypothetical protein AAB692_00150 [Patescibacteria group bacterium]